MSLFVSSLAVSLENKILSSIQFLLSQVVVREGCAPLETSCHLWLMSWGAQVDLSLFFIQSSLQLLRVSVQGTRMWLPIDQMINRSSTCVVLASQSIRVLRLSKLLGYVTSVGVAEMLRKNVEDKSPPGQ